jgi:hypothetical protein
MYTLPYVLVLTQFGANDLRTLHYLKLHPGTCDIKVKERDCNVPLCPYVFTKTKGMGLIKPEIC